jgi:hypothetical protein
MFSHYATLFLLSAIVCSLGCENKTNSVPSPALTSAPLGKSTTKKNEPKATPIVADATPVVAKLVGKVSAINQQQQPTSQPTRPSLAELAQDKTQPILTEVDPLRFPQPEMNAALCQARGIRKLESKHLILYTDIPTSPAIEELPHLFDTALPQWCKYFHIPETRLEKWKMLGVLAQNREKFLNTGLWPKEIPEFLNGFTRAGQFWCYEQESDYYRRHLVLHEGTHGFMEACLGYMGPPWYAEGMAELLGTHTWKNGKLTLGVMPHHKEQFPLWGRLKIVRDDFNSNNGQTLEQIMSYSADAHRQVRPYAWCWAAAIFFDRTSDTQTPFRQLPQALGEPEAAFNTRFWNTLPSPAPHTREAWQWFVANADYGYDLERESILRLKTLIDLPTSGAKTKVLANRGWQSTGWRLAAGQKYHIRATGEFQIAHVKKPYISQADGITLRYVRGQPLGKLLAAVTDEGQSPGLSPLLSPVPIGTSGHITCDNPGVLYLRINDSPAELSDNEGELEVTVEKS